MSVKVHERRELVVGAELDLHDTLLKIIEERGLTYIEVLVILTSIAARWSGNALRAERHPDNPEKSAGEA